MKTALMLLTGLLVLGAFEGLFHLVRFLRERRERELKRRIEAIAGVGAPIPAAGASLIERRDPYSGAPGTAAWLRGLPGTERAAALLEQANSEFTVARLLGVTAVAGMGGLAVGLAVGLGGGRSLALGALLSLVPWWMLKRARASRSSKLSEQLADALDMMARSLKAGHTIPASFQLIASEMPMPIALEFGRAFEEQRLGLTVDEAVRHITERAPQNRDLRIFAVSITIQRETGGNLAEVLENNARTLRARYRFHSKLKALTAEGRASGLVLGVMPPAMLAFLLLVNREYVGVLFSHPMGRMILMLAVASWLVGGLWMRRLGKVEF